MQLKLLLTVLAAGSALGRLHGHDRRHAHPNVDANVDVEVDKRGANAMVTATINGVLVSWINNWSGQQTANDAQPTDTTTKHKNNKNNKNNKPNAPANNNAPAPTDAQPTQTTVNAPTATSDNDKRWFAVPQSGQFSRAGFGGMTGAQGSSSSIQYQGNVGDPWGSNIILVPHSKANQYKHVLRFEGSNTDKWTVIFWNKIGPNGQMDGWYGHKALEFSVLPNEVKYVAIDDNSQGAFGAAKGNTLPVDTWGGWASTWGEFDMSNTGNNGYSGWDVSAIQAQAAGLFVQGMKICTHEGTLCSSITNSLLGIFNAYTQSLANVGGVGGSMKANAVRLVAKLDYE